MEQSIFGCSEKEFQSRIKLEKIFVIVSPLIVLIVNVILAVFHNETNHVAVLVSNILLDVVFGICYYLFLSFYFLVNVRIGKLVNAPKEIIEEVVNDVSEDTEKYCGLDCRRVKLDSRVVYLVDNGRIVVEKGLVTLTVASGIIIKTGVEGRNDERKIDDNAL